MENREMGRGWPLGLGSMHMRLTLLDTFPVDASETRALVFPSTSFSSFSSSTLDTESTVSFFQDKSKSLGRLIGIRPRKRRSSELYLRNSIDRLEELQGLPSRGLPEEYHNEQNPHDHSSDMEMCHGFCVPLICLVAKSSSSKHGSKR